jgi:hypothetical protein
MPGRKITDESDAHACLEAAAASGLTRAGWARAHGVDARSLNAWRVNLERRSRGQGTRSELRLVELVSQEPCGPPTGSGVRLVMGELVVEVDRGFDQGTLLAVLDVVAAC